MLYILRTLIRKLPGIVIRAVPLPAPETLEGFGAREKAGELCRKNGMKKVLLVTDRTVYSLGYHEKIASSLEKCGVDFSVFPDIASEPDLTIIENGRKALTLCGADAVIALGGGAVMDSCKMIAAGGRMKRRKTASLLRKFLFVRGKTLPIIAVPTTAGTGAEITVGAVVTNAKGQKGSSVVVGLDVRGVILDGELTLRMPKGITSACGIDALSHGLEGVAASVRSADEDTRKSMECVKLVLENLPVLLRDPEDREARQKMCLAAHYGGNAINKELAGYVHAFAHPIGARFHISHGNAIALALLPVMEAQKHTCREKLAALARYCGLSGEAEEDAAACDKLLEAIGELIELCAFDRTAVRIPEKDYKPLARAIAWDAINYSPPIVFSDKRIYAVLDKINREVKENAVRR